MVALMWPAVSIVVRTHPTLSLPSILIFIESTRHLEQFNLAIKEIYHCKNEIYFLQIDRKACPLAATRNPDLRPIITCGRVTLVSLCNFAWYLCEMHSCKLP